MPILTPMSEALNGRQDRIFSFKVDDSQIPVSKAARLGDYQSLRKKCGRQVLTALGAG
jgi:hypothetical protein